MILISLTLEKVLEVFWYWRKAEEDARGFYIGFAGASLKLADASHVHTLPIENKSESNS
jgi:hypothetical protein